jgi:hypothetical protein
MVANQSYLTLYEATTLPHHVVTTQYWTGQFCAPVAGIKGDEMKIEETIRQVSEDSIKNDQALLKLGEVLTERITQLTENQRMMQEQIFILQNKVLDLYQKMETVLEVIHTHFTDTEVH